MFCVFRVEATRRCPGSAELLEQLVHCRVAQLALHEARSRQHRILLELGVQELRRSPGTQFIQNTHGTHLHIACPVHKTEHRVVLRQGRTQHVVEPAEHRRQEALDTRHFRLERLAHGTQNAFVVNLDVDLFPVDLHRNGVRPGVDLAGGLHSSSLAVPCVLGLDCVNLPQAGNRIVLHQLQEDFPDKVLLTTGHGTLVVGDDVFKDVASTRATTQRTHRFLAANVVPATTATDRLCNVLIQAAQGDVVLEHVLQVVVLGLRDESLIQHLQACGIGDCHQLRMQHLKVRRFAFVLELREDRSRLGISHARPAIREPLVDLGDVRVPLRRVLGVGVQGQLVRSQVQFLRLLDEWFKLLLSEVTQSFFDPAIHALFGLVHIGHFRHQTAAPGDCLLNPEDR